MGDYYLLGEPGPHRETELSFLMPVSATKSQMKDNRSRESYQWLYASRTSQNVSDDMGSVTLSAVMDEAPNLL